MNLVRQNAMQRQNQTGESNENEEEEEDEEELRLGKKAPGEKTLWARKKTEPGETNGATW